MVSNTTSHGITAQAAPPLFYAQHNASLSQPCSTRDDAKDIDLEKAHSHESSLDISVNAPVPTWRSAIQRKFISTLVPRPILARYLPAYLPSRQSTNTTAALEAAVTLALSALSLASPAEALISLASRQGGLYPAEVLERQALYGRNVLSGANPPSNLRLAGRAIANPFNALLGLIAVVSIATGDRFTFTFMFLMVSAGSIIRFWQERKSIQKASGLAARLTSNVAVHRFSTSSESIEQSLPRVDLVPGDVIQLSSGSLIPADCILLSSSSLSVSMSCLTGEVMPVDKSILSNSCESSSSSFLDSEVDGIVGGGEILSRKNVLLAGTSVSAGEGRAVVVQIGDKTYTGSLALMLGSSRPINAFDVSIRRVAYLLITFMAVMVPIVFVIQGTTNKDAGWNAAFIFSISVAVGLVPELLPVIVSGNLARGALLLGKRNVIVKRLDAVQNLGALSVVCSDKTGTLTVDEVRFAYGADGFGEKSAQVLHFAVVNSRLQSGTRSLLDRAIVLAGEEDKSENGKAAEMIKLGEVPFDSARRLLSIFVTEENSIDALIITKGAVDEVLHHCTHYCFDSSASSSIFGAESSPVTQLDAAALAKIHQTAHLLNNDGLRLVAAAKRVVHSYADYKGLSQFGKEEERDLVFIGFLAFLDPPKEDARGAIEELRSLGVQVKILTGDAPTIALKVARDIGLLPPLSEAQKISALVLSTPLTVAQNPDLITGAQLAQLSMGEREDFIIACRRAVVFAKLSPYQKLEVVEALKEGNKDGKDVVGMLGDGVNDAIALRGADVGISVDSGSETAKDAADIVLMEKSLSSIAEGVRLGRITALNTVKYIKITASSNFGNVFSILAASAWLPYQPMLPTQILVQNMLYDFSQTAIPWDSVDQDYLEKSPVTWGIASVARFMIIFGPTSSIFDIATFSLNWWYYGIQTADSDMVPLAQTHWFTEGFVTQMLVVYFLRTGKIPFLQSSPSRPLLFSTLFFLGVALALPYIPKLGDLLGFVHLDATFYGFLAVIVVLYCTLVQLVKTGYQQIWKEWL